jgi:hypothetical protein
MGFFFLFDLFEGFHDGEVFVFAAEAADEFVGDGLDEDAFGGGLNVGLGACFYLKFFAEVPGDDDLAFDGKVNGIGLGFYFHVYSLLFIKGKSIIFCYNILAIARSRPMLG